MTPQEERLVLELHSKWGNRWSRIARKLPGRTDNEIKNYWRTHMRKKAQEKKRAGTSSSSSPSPASSMETGEEGFYDTGGPNMISPSETQIGEDQAHEEGYSMDDIWKDIAVLSEENSLEPVFDVHSEEGGCNFSCPSMPSPSWDYSSDSLWVLDEEESKIFHPMGDPIFPCYQQGTPFVIG